MSLIPIWGFVVSNSYPIHAATELIDYEIELLVSIVLFHDMTTYFDLYNMTLCTNR